MATVEGTLPRGVKVGDVLHKDFVMRDANTADMFDAEDDAPVSKRLSYRGALLGRQLVKLGELSGPIGIEVIRKLCPSDFDVLVAAQDAVDKLGKSEPVS